MNAPLHNYKLLAFIVAFKKQRRNSIIHNGESHYTLAKEVGISINTFKKYYKACKKLKLLVALGKHQQFVSLKMCNELLFLDGHGKKIEYFKSITYVENKVKIIYNGILYAIAKRNYRQQEFQINRKAPVIRSRHNRVSEKGDTSRISTMAKKECGGSVALLISTCYSKQSVVTGKIHCSNNIGCSISSGTRLLRKWHKSGLIFRHINRWQVNMPVNAGTASIVAEKCTHYNPLYHRQGFSLFYGSKIVSFR